MVGYRASAAADIGYGCRSHTLAPKQHQGIFSAVFLPKMRFIVFLGLGYTIANDDEQPVVVL